MTTITQKEFAELLGKDKSYVTRLKQAGRLVMSGDLVDVEASMARIAATADPSKAHVAERHAAAKGEAPRQPASEAIGNTFQQAKAVKEKYAALLLKTEYEEKTRKLIDRDESDKDIRDVLIFALRDMENIPHRVAGHLVGKDFDQILAILREAITESIVSINKEASKLLSDVNG